MKSTDHLTELMTASTLSLRARMARCNKAADAGEQSRKSVEVLVALSALAMQFAAPGLAIAADLNLGSPDASHTVDSNYQGGVSLIINGESKPVVAGQVLTGAEYATFINALNGEKQTLNIGANGAATGGYLNFTPQLAHNVSGLVVPNSINVFHDFGAGALNFTGNLTNSGNFYALSTSNTVTNAVISAANLTNNQGALLSSVLPTGGLPGITNTVQNLSLTLNIMNTLFNSGTISSAGNLSVNAGAIYNQLPANVTGVTPIMQAIGNLNLNATLGNITNAGTLAAITGNVNLASINNMVVNNVGGSVEALLGNISVRDVLFTAKKDLEITGGNWLSNQLNLYSGGGQIKANINELTGVLNATGNNIIVSASSSQFTLGTVNVTGDPLFINPTGDFQISQDINVSAPLSIMAAGNVTAKAGVTSIKTNTNNLLISAGGVLQLDAAGTVTLFDRTGTPGQGGGGGNIDLAGVNIDTSGGNAIIFTLGGNVNGGTITTGALTTAGPVAGSATTVISDASRSNVNSGIAVDIGNVRSHFNAAASATFAAAHPTLSLTSADCNPCIRVDSAGGLIAGSTVTAGQLQPGMSVRVSSINTQGTQLTLSGERVIVTGNLTNEQAFNGVASTTINTNSVLPFEIGKPGTANGIGGKLFAATVENFGPGTVTINNTGEGGVVLRGNSVILGSTSGSPGPSTSITVNALNGSIRMDQNDGPLDTSAAFAPGSGGNITFNAKQIVATGATPVMLLSNGAGGNGGTITLNSTDANSSIAFGTTGGGVFSVSAKGNTGGQLSVTSAGGVKLDPAAVDLSGTSGGGTFFLKTTTPIANLLVTSDLKVSSGAAGKITLDSASAQPFIIDKNNPSIVNGVIGELEAKASTFGLPDGGSISVTSASSLTVSSKVTASGTAPIVTLTASGSNGGNGLTIQDPTLIAAAGSGGIGTLILNSVTAPFAVITPGVFGVGGSTWGRFELTAFSISPTSDFSVSAGGTPVGNKGGAIVSITTTSSAYDLSFGGPNRTIFNIVNGPEVGNVSISSAGNLTIDMTGIQFVPQFGFGKGGNLTLSAGGDGASQLGNLQVNGVLSARSDVTFQAGAITLISNSPTPFTFGAGAVNGVTSGKIDVGGKFGSPGAISITNRGTGGINVPGPAVFNYAIDNMVGNQGNGGRLTLVAPNGPINLGAGTYDLSSLAGGAPGTLTGGQFDLVAKDLVLGGFVFINAFMSPAFQTVGGTISITETGDAVNDLVISPTTLKLDAGSGTRGSISVSASKGLTVDMAAANIGIGPNGSFGAGGKFSFTAGTLVPADLNISGDLNVSSNNPTIDAGSVTLKGNNVTVTAGGINISNMAPAQVGTVQNAGTVSITTDSSTQLIVGPGVFPGPTNSVSFIQGFSLGNGGSVSLTNNGTGGVGIGFGLGLAAQNGNGASVTINAPRGPVQYSSAVPVDLNGKGTNSNGGHLEVNALQIFMFGEFQANSTGTGTGGTFKLVQTGLGAAGFPGFTVGQGLKLTASSNAGGAAAAPSVILSAGGDLIVDMAGIKVAATNGNGATFDFSAGTALGSAVNSLNVTGDINASAAGSGIVARAGDVTLRSSGDIRVSGSIFADSVGGTIAAPIEAGHITINTNSTNPFFLPLGLVLPFGPSGVTGTISAQTAVGAGGQLIISAGLGPVSIDPSKINVSTGAGSGGFVSIKAPFAAITLTGGTLDVSGKGGTLLKPSDGGFIAIQGQSITTPNHLSLLANGGDFGNAGQVTLSASGAASSIALGTIAQLGTFSISAATNNGAGGGSGNGGVAKILAGRQIEVTPLTSVLQVAGGQNGNSGVVVLQAFGTAGGCCGNVYINAPLTAYQDQGVIFSIGVNSTTPFVIGTPTQLNGIAGDVNLSGAQNVANAGYYGGGTLRVFNAGTGGITLSPGTTILSIGGTNNAFAGGGNISLEAGSGVLTYANNVINVDAGFAPPVPNPNQIPGSPGASGGRVLLQGANIVAAAGTIAPLQVQTRGGAGGQGGTVVIQNDGVFSNLAIANTAGAIAINATGGARGGTIDLRTGGNLSVSATALVFNTNSAKNGDGGSVSLSAGQQILWTGALNVNGLGIGDGGSVTINQKGFSPFSINQNGFNGITGALSFSPGTSGGNGGSFSLTSNGGLSVSGGTTLDASAFTVTASGIDAPKFNAGNITINVPTVTIQGAGILAISANGAGNGNGGTIDLTTTNFLNINVGGATPQFSFIAHGGSANSISGDGGTIKLTTPASINVANAALLSASPLGLSGKGASYSFISNSFGTVNYNGSIVSSGVGFGDGGDITIKQSTFSTLSIGSGNAVSGINGALSAAGGNSGFTAKGGNILVEAGSVTIGSGNFIDARATSAQGAGGSVTINATTVTPQAGIAPTVITATGGLAGKGGSITVSAPNSDMTLGAGGGQLALLAGAGANAKLGGDGGSVSVTAKTLILTSMPSVSAGQGGKGGTLKLSATGNIQSQVGLAVDGGSTFGAGGLLMITAGNTSPFFGIPTQFSINNGATSNGIAGDLSAKGSGPQDGGTIVIINQSGGITVGAAAKITVTSSGGNSGNIGLQGRGIVSILSSGLSANGTVGNGGILSIIANSINGPAAGPLLLAANGGTEGSGGSVTVVTTANDLTGNITTGTSTGQLQLQAKGGARIGGITRGGTITIDGSGPNLTINPSGVDVSVNNANGNGGRIVLVGGLTTASGVNLFVPGKLNVSGVGRGDGGSIAITVKSTNVFTVGPTAIVNGVAGTLQANAGNVFGSGGSVNIELRSPSSLGGIQFNPGQNVFVDGTNGGNGGFVGASASGSLSMQFSGSTSFAADGSSAAGAGGGISLTAGRFVLGANNISLSAKGGTAGNGGEIFLTSNGAAGAGADINIGSGVGAFSINASGGTTGGNGGLLSVKNTSSTNSISITGNPVIGPNAAVGNGGRLTLNGAGAVLVLNDLTVNGGQSSGKGGVVSISSGSSSPLTIGAAATTNGVRGNITAAGGTLSGDGGTIELISATGGITLGTGALLSVGPGSYGNGGKLILSSSNGKVDLGTSASPLVSNANSTNGDGGSIDITAASLLAAPGATLSVVGLNGGKVSVALTNGSSTLNVTPSGIKIDVHPQATFFAAGRAGDISLSSAGTVNIDGTSIINSTLNVQSLGGSISVQSGTGGIGNINITSFLSTGISPTSVLSLQTGGFSNTINVQGFLSSRTVLIQTSGSFGTAALPVFIAAVSDRTAGVSIKTTGAGTNVFVQTNGVLFDSGGNASSFSVIYGGDLFVTGSGISGPNLTQVSITGGNGNLSILGGISGATFGSTATLSTGLTGTITASGVIRTSNIVLSGNTGDIGAKFAPITTTATNITVNSKASAYLFSSALPPSIVTLNASSATASLELNACASISVSGTQTTPILTLGSLGGDINAFGTALNNTGSVGITRANNVSLQSGASLTINQSTVTNNFTASTTGALSVAGTIQAANITLSTSGINMPISINQPISAVASAGTPTISLSGTGSILIGAALAGNTVNISTTGGASSNITLNQTITTTGSNNVVSITALSGAALLRTNGGIVGNQLNLSFSGPVGQLNSRIFTNVNFLNLSGFGAANDVFIRQSNSVTLGASGSASIGGALNLLMLQGTLTFQSFNAGGNVTISHTGIGSINQNASGFASNTTGGISITASLDTSISLLGSVSAGGTGNLSVAANGLNQTVTAGSLSAGAGTLNVQANGAVTQLTNTSWSTSNGAIQINSANNAVLLNGSLSTGTSGSVDINAPQAITVGNISTGFSGTNGVSVVTPGGAVTQLANTTIRTGMNGNINLSGVTLSLQGLSAQGTGTVQANAVTGNLTVGSSVSGASVSLTSVGGVNTINGTVRSNGTTVTINGDLGVNINQAVSTSAGPLQVASALGSITSTTTGTLSATNGDITILALNSIQLSGTVSASSSGTSRNIQITSFGAATVGAINNSNGSVNVESRGGTLQVNGSISVNNGDVVIQQKGMNPTDKIVIGNQVNIFALAPSPTLGNITVAVFPGAVVPQIVGTPPIGGTTNTITQAPGKIYFGPNPFSNTGTTTLFAKGANITFYNSSGVSAIQLNSNYFFADPPGGPLAPVPSIVPPAGQVWFAPPAVSASTTPVSSNTGTGAAASPGSFVIPAAAQSASLALPAIAGTVFRSQQDRVDPSTAPTNQTVRSNLSTGSTVNPLLNQSGAHGAFNSSGRGSWSAAPESTSNNQRSTSSTTFKYAGEAAATTAGTVNALVGFVSKKAGLFASTPSYLKASQDSIVERLDENTFALSQGELILSANKRAIVYAGQHKIESAAGAIVHVTRSGNTLLVRNLCDVAAKSVAIVIAGKSTHIKPGEEVLVTPEDRSSEVILKGDNIGRRNVSRFVVDGKQSIIRSELSIISLIQHSKLLSNMYTNGSAADRSVIEKVMKMAAALFQVTGKRGAYSACEPGKINAVEVSSGTAEPARIADLR